MLEERVKKILIKNGWYEGRKIDITNYVEALESNGYEVFDAAKKFLEEFGELDIIASYIDESGKEDYDGHTTKCRSFLNTYKSHFNYDEEVGEKTIPVCRLYLGDYILCISESGKLFFNYGLRAENSDDFWNLQLGEEMGGFKSWIDYKYGGDFKESGQKNKKYF